tara:strand:+ start:370 stop:612 length:243 start_codon:yes stop_codon:yes gene_type:complete
MANGAVPLRLRLNAGLGHAVAGAGKQMIRKTDRYLKRRTKVWERGYASSEKVAEYVRRETWWLLFVVPVYSRDTVIDKPR